MQLWILDSNYDRVGIVDEYESVLWLKKYNDVGECEIYVPCDEAMLDLLKRGNYVYRYDDDMLCKIENIKIETDVENGDYIIATAKDICRILAGRIVRWQIVFSGTVARFIEKVLTDNVIDTLPTRRAIPNFRIDTSNFSQFTERIEKSAFTEDLLQLIVTTCKTYNLGFRLSYDMDARELVFRLYRGADKATGAGGEIVEFSPTFANILSTEYEEDDSEYKNVVYVGYKDEAGYDHLLSLYNGDDEPQGEQRRELYVDGSSTSRDITLEELEQLFGTVRKTTTTTTERTTSIYWAIHNGGDRIVATSDGIGDDEKITVSDYTYLLLIRALGQDALEQHKVTRAFVGSADTIDTYEYKTDYDLGDTVRAANEYGITGNAQITEIMESDDNEDGLVIEPTFEYLS